MKTSLLAISTSILLAFTATAQEVPITRDQATEFATTILPYETDNKFHKWAHSPSISCVGEAVKFKPLVQQFVDDMAFVFAGLPVTPTLGADNDLKADILLVIDSPKVLAEVKRKERTQGKWQWHGTWHPDGYLKRFVVYNDITHYTNLSGTNERRMVYTSLLKGMGISASKGFPVISIWGQFSQGTATEAMWEKDKKLTRFAYEFVPANATRETIRREVRKNWK